MKIGNWELRNIRDKILNELYKKSENALDVRKTGIAKQNRDYFLNPLATTIQNLPEQLLAHSKVYSVSIKYEPTTETEDNVIENWNYHSEAPIINPVDNFSTASSYYGVPAQTLDPRLHSTAEILCKDILKVRVERRTMTKYLDSTMARYTGSLQLRKVWPESLHKHLPPEPVKTPRKYKKVGIKKVEVADPAVPNSLNIRLTENLLEEM
jgi:hypothetical protein